MGKEENLREIRKGDYLTIRQKCELCGQVYSCQIQVPTLTSSPLKIEECREIAEGLAQFLHLKTYHFN